jgi:hypothetical protein
LALKGRSNTHFPPLLPAWLFIVSFTFGLPFFSAGGPRDLWAYPSDPDMLSAEFWTELDPVVDFSHSGIIDQETAIRRTLEEARGVLSGMIYGYDVRYVPSDNARGVEEELEITPRALIPAGDPALRVLDVRTGSNKYYVHIRYNLSDHQIQRLRAWSSNIYDSASGRGVSSLQGGYQAKFDSFHQAIKNAIREYLRVRIKNKPRLIEARVVLVMPPYTIIDAGGYHSTVRIKMDLRDVLPYSAY